MITELFYLIGNRFNNAILLRDHTYNEDVFTGMFVLSLIFILKIILITILKRKVKFK